jgi:hypothetical protein
MTSDPLSEQERRAVDRMQHPDQAQVKEWLDQDSLMYGALIGVGVLMVQPFLTAPALDLTAVISVVAFSVSIPLLAALMLVNRQEAFHGRPSRSILLSIGQESPRQPPSSAWSLLSGISIGSPGSGY